jgi:hypothetical protein
MHKKPFLASVDALALDRWRRGYLANTGIQTLAASTTRCLMRSRPGACGQQACVNNSTRQIQETQVQVGFS